MFQQLLVSYFRKAVSTGILLGVDDAEDVLTSRAAAAEAELPRPRSVIETTARRLEEPARNGRKKAAR